MKNAFVMIVCAAGLIGAAARADSDHLVATVIPAQTLAAVAAAAPDGEVSDQQVVHVESAEGRLGIGIVHRPLLEAAGPVAGIRHDRQSEVYRVLAGSGTLVTSSRMSQVKNLDPDGEIVRTLTGPSAVGVIEEIDDSRQIGEGDVVIIPAGVAHGFSEITAPITYMVVRVDPERLVALK